MSELENGRSVNGTHGERGVLTNLPRARPQRASARRIAERNGTGARARHGTRKMSVERAAKTAVNAAAASAKEPSERPPAKRSVEAVGESAASSTAKASRGERASAARPSRRAAQSRGAKAKRPRPASIAEPAPRQGFECDAEAPSGSVQPPGGVELVASAAELVGELAKAGVTAGERMLKDVLSRLPL